MSAYLIKNDNYKYANECRFFICFTIAKVNEDIILNIIIQMSNHNISFMSFIIYFFS